MSQNTPFVGDVGTKIIVDVGVDANDIVTAKLLVKKPDKTTTEWVATPIANTQTVEYIIKEGDLNVAGGYQIQAYIETNNWKGYGTICGFTVSPHLL